MLMSATSHAGHTHGWEHPNVLDWELPNGEDERESLLGRDSLPSSSFSQILPQPLRELSSACQVRISALPGIEPHGGSEWVLY